jgi:hypothetical protein
MGPQSRRPAHLPRPDQAAVSLGSIDADIRHALHLLLTVRDVFATTPERAAEPAFEGALAPGFGAHILGHLESSAGGEVSVDRPSP